MENLQEYLSNEENLSKVTSHLSESGYVIRKSEEEENFLKKHEDEKIAPRVREIGDRVENDIAEHLGIKKEGAEKYYDVIKRAGSVFQSIKEENESLKSKIGEIEKGGKIDDATKRELQELKETIALNNSKFEEERNSWNQERETNKKTSYIDKSLKINSNLPDDALKTTLNDAKKYLLQLDTEWRDGELAYIKDGRALRNSDSSLMTPNDLIKEIYPSLFNKVEDKKSGAGVTEVVKNDNGKLFVDVKNIPSDIKNQVELDTFLMKAGLDNRTKEYNDIRNKTISERNLPLR